jgi:membrane-bound lytic murein transglycosylase D
VIAAVDGPAAKDGTEAPRTRLVRGKHGKMIRVVERRPALSQAKTTKAARTKVAAKAPAKRVVKTAAKPAAKVTSKVTRTAQR